MKKTTLAACFCLALLALGASARPFSKAPECPEPPPPAEQDRYLAVSAPRDQINQLTATLHASGRFIAMVPDDLQPGCYILTYWQNF